MEPASFVAGAALAAFFAFILYKITRPRKKGSGSGSGVRGGGSGGADRHRLDEK